MFLEYALTATAHLNKCHCLPAPLLVLPIGVRPSVPTNSLTIKTKPAVLANSLIMAEIVNKSTHPQSSPDHMCI